jgi:hypothetical protein
MKPDAPVIPTTIRRCFGILALPFSLGFHGPWNRLF